MAKKKLDKIATDELSRELQRRQRRLPKLKTKRNQLYAQLKEVEAEITLLGGDQPAGRSSRGKARGETPRKRPRNEASLPDAIAQVLKGRKKPLGVGEIAEAVQKQGYRSSAKNFRTIVNQALVRDERFKQAERGKYRLAG